MSSSCHPSRGADLFALRDEPLPEGLPISIHHAGAVVSFVGCVRDFNEGRKVVALEYEAQPELAAKEAHRILVEARERFGLVDAACVHRVGRLSVGEAAIRVEVSAAHRQEAFAGCAYIVDEVKARVPIWKKEHYADGESGWINASPSGEPSPLENAGEEAR